MSSRVRHHGGNRPILLTLALAGILVTTLSQCRLVPDNITGVTTTPGRLSGRSACIHDCNEQFRIAMETEESIHRAALKACGHDQACRQAEDARHHDAEDRIHDDKKACKKNCYNEGGGTGGV